MATLELIVWTVAGTAALLLLATVAPLPVRLLPAPGAASGPWILRGAVGVGVIGGLVAIGASPAITATPPPSGRMGSMAPAVASLGPAAYPLGVPTLVRAGDPSEHVVKPGESLWRIARSILVERGESPSTPSIGQLWRSIYRANREVIGANPNLIHPGDVLVIPGDSNG